MQQDVMEAWEAVAPAWEENRDFIARTTAPFSDRLIERLELRPGIDVLELACGTGDLGFNIAARIAPGTLIQSDVSPSMLAAAERGARASSIPNIVHRVLDAQALDLPDEHVDAVACRFGYMLMPDQKAAFAEACRVLRPGGRLVFAVWGPAERNMWIVAMALPLVQLGRLPLSDPTAAGGIFSLASEEHLRGLLTAAGFGRTTVEEVTVTTEVDDFDQWWDRQAKMAGPLASTIESLADEERTAARDGTRRIAEQMRDGDRYLIPATAIVVSAEVKP